MKRNIFRVITAALLLAIALCSISACKENEGNNGVADGDGEPKVQYAIKYNGQTVTLGGDAKKTVAKIGEPASKQSTGNCGGQGETVRYDYSSFIMVVVEYESGAKIDQIEIRNDLISTVGGVTIGSSETSVKAAYGEPDEVRSSTLIYKKGNQRINVGIEDGCVSFLTMKVEG